MQAKNEMEALKSLNERTTICFRTNKYNFCAEDEEWKSRRH